VGFRFSLACFFFLLPGFSLLMFWGGFPTNSSPSPLPSDTLPPPRGTPSVFNPLLRGFFLGLLSWVCALRVGTYYSLFVIFASTSRLLCAPEFTIFSPCVSPFLNLAVIPLFSPFSLQEPAPQSFQRTGFCLSKLPFPVTSPFLPHWNSQDCPFDTFTGSSEAIAWTALFWCISTHYSPSSSPVTPFSRQSVEPVATFPPCHELPLSWCPDREI